jgi:dipeptidyl aminopeptidase/acylaminoacyl peptidase
MIDFHGSTGYGQKFTDSISQHWGDRPLEDLQKGWAHALAKYEFLDGGRACALGASYGGYMVNWIAGNWFDAKANRRGSAWSATTACSIRARWAWSPKNSGSPSGISAAPFTTSRRTTSASTPRESSYRSGKCRC